MAQKAGFENISLDLIFGIPGQTRADWQRDLDRTLSYRPDHLSCYMLTYESETPLARAVAAGQVVALSEARTADLMETAIRCGKFPATISSPFKWRKSSPTYPEGRFLSTWTTALAVRVRYGLLANEANL